MALQTASKKILFSGPGKTDEELLLALENCNRIVLLIDNFNELSRLSVLIKKSDLNRNLNVGVRIRGNRNGRWDKFGIPLQDLAKFADNTSKTDGIIFKGIQFHSSWNMDPSRQVSMMTDVGDYLMRKLPVHILKNLEFIDIGGGFWPEQGEWLNPGNLPIAKIADALGEQVVLKDMHYYQPSLSIDNFAKIIGECLLSQPKPIRDLELFMEPGRWISHPSMHILLRVIDKKDSNAVITDGGINLLGWERPLTEFIPIINLTRFHIREQALKIYGSLCAPEDRWGDSIFGKDAVPGDILLVPDQGAYTYSLRHKFIKPIAKVVKYDGESLEQVEKQNV
jgi:diaminopimelate decarboxylase